MGSQKTTIKVIEIEKAELKPGAKYIITIDPQFADYVDSLEDALFDLVGPSCIVLAIPKSSVGVFEIMPEETQNA